MRTITTITAKHKRCPNCGSEKPMLAKVGEIRPLLGDGA
jgi:ribosomal protein S27AE